jgi:single-stranded DNA-binding protein
MNSCILMATIVSKPELRHTSDTQTAVTDMLVEFEGAKPEERSRVRVVGWGNLAEEIYENYAEGDSVIIVGRLSMRSVDNPRGFKEKKAELVVSSIQRTDGQISAPSSSKATASSDRATASKAPRLSTVAVVEETNDSSFTDRSEVETPSKSRQPVSTYSEDEIPF